MFGIAASAGLALLPLIARDRLGGGPVVYGLLLGAFGVGALLGAFLIHPLRQRRGAERVVTAPGAVALAHVPDLVHCLNERHGVDERNSVLDQHQHRAGLAVERECQLDVGQLPQA